MDMAEIKRLKMKIGRSTAQLIEECTEAEGTVPGSTAAAQDVKKIVDKAFDLIGDDPFGQAIDKIADRHGTTMPNKTAEGMLRGICELLDEARQ